MPAVSVNDPMFATVGENNRNLLVQAKKLAPFHEDITRRQPFEPQSVSPGQYTRIKLDFKHATDREIILNDIRLRFALDLSARGAGVGNVFAVRGTDLIRELTLKLNEDIVFKADKFQELNHLWLMNNHKQGGERADVRHSYLMNAGAVPSGISPPFYYKDADKCWYTDTGLTTQLTGDALTLHTVPGVERHDGLPRVCYSDNAPYNAGAPYRFHFDMSLNQLVGPIFHRLHLRRIEFVQIDLMFEPWVSPGMTQNYLLFDRNPNAAGTTHPYAVAKFVDLEIRQYRTTLLDGIEGFTLPDNRMLSWLMHRYSRREYAVDLTNPNFTLDLQLNDWEIRTNIVRLWWMLSPINPAPYEVNGGNGFAPYAAPCEPYEQLTGVEIRWKNDKVLDLDTVFQVYRHYVLSDNKRYSLNDPYQECRRLLFPDPANRTDNAEDVYYTWNNSSRDASVTGTEHYEMPIYHVDLSMNIQAGVPGAEIVGGIVNDTSDYVIRLKRVLRDESNSTPDAFVHKTQNGRILYVWIEYQTLVNLAAGSHQFTRGSQTVTKQLNVL